MMATRELARPPRILPLYLRTAATLVPGASHLPGVPGSGGTMPALELTLKDLAIEPQRLAAYREVCGFAASDAIPPTYPHILAFRLHMALMADPGFPFAAVGLVHLENEITQLRALGEDELLSLAVHASEPEQHQRGRTFAILTTVEVDGELVWHERSTMLRRERTSERSGERGAAETGESAISLSRERSTVIARETWTLAGDLGRRYGAISGDRNPIHMHSLGGKAFGFPRAIAHGMWTKARSLAAIAQELPEAFSVKTRFRRPVTIPGSVSFESDRRGEELRFALRSRSREQLHLLGEVGAPVAREAKATSAAARAKAEAGR
jgi:acyl dehydratase